MNNTYLFSAGGSGGHLFPGIAVAHRLLQSEPRARIVFAGSERPFERELVLREGFEHRALPAVSTTDLARNPPTFLWKHWQSLRTARELVQNLQPRVVVGCGGFASVPAAAAAARAGIPLILLEQNAVPGKATCWLARRATKICVSHAASVPFLPRGSRCTLTGNPVRTDIAQLARRPRRSRDRRDDFCLLVLGGSHGARGINDAMLQTIFREADAFDGWRIVHQTGAADHDRVAAACGQAAVNIESFPFIDDMARAYADADLVLARSGATTLAELACAALPAVLVPFPHAAGDHQRKNAEVIARAGAGRILMESRRPQAFARGLGTTLLPLLADTARRGTMSQAMQRLAHPDAADNVALELMHVAQRRAA